MNTKNFRFRTLDLMLATFVVALICVAAKDGPVHGSEYSYIVHMLLAGILGAATSRIVSDSFRFGTVCGLLLGVLGYYLAIFTLALGIKVADQLMVLAFVGAGGIIGGLVPTTWHRLRRASFRSRMSILFVCVCVLVLLTLRWRAVSEKISNVAKLEAAGAWVNYPDRNLLPAIFDSDRMINSNELSSLSVWLRELLGMRVATSVGLPTYKKVNQYEVLQLLIDELPTVKSLSLHADHMDDKVFELLNSGKLSRLESLSIEGPGFGDSSLSRLDPLPNLVVLDLQSTSITDESIEHIASFPRLKLIVVIETDLTADGIKRLKSKIGKVYTEY